MQEVPQALSSLKYFYEKAPNFYIIAAGSLLGISLHQNVSFPVGKVEFLKLYPLDFQEFLLALNKENLVDLILNKNWELVNSFRETYIHLLKLYYFIGGMPEVVQCFIETQNLDVIVEIQKNLLMAYEQDFSKHIQDWQTVQRIRAIWNELPSQLAKENKKFIYSQLQKGARAKDYELALQWLKDSGLVYAVSRIKKPNLPLSSYQDKAFKLFSLDIGLLSAQSNLDATTILEKNRIFNEFKGALTEQYVLQQLLATQKNPIFYWSNDRGSAEVDFVLEKRQSLIPIEVKAEENLKAKSLKLFVEQFNLPKGLRISMANYRLEEWLVNLPLFAIFIFDGLI